MSSLSKSKFVASSLGASASAWNAVSALKNVDKDSTYLEEAIRKVRGHPDFKDLPSAEIKQQAKKLTSTESMKEYFSEYLTLAQRNVLQVTAASGDPQITTASSQNGDLQVATASGPDSSVKVTTTPTKESVLQASTQDKVQQAEEASVNTDPSDSDCPEAPKLDPYSHVRNVATFPVKLFLTSLPPDDMIADNGYASLLETTYGPMHASLQVGHTMIEWSPYHLVVPHFNVPSEAVIKTDITRSLKVASELRTKAREYRKSRRGTITGEVDLLYEISKSISSVIEAVIQVVVSWNRYKYFHTYGTNSQHFVQNIMAVLGIEELPLASQNLSAYIGRLKGEFRSKTHVSFRSHAELDSYVGGRVGKLSTSEMEYLLTEYYRFHVASRAGAVHATTEWRCEEEECQMQRLEREIDGKELLITSLRLT